MVKRKNKWLVIIPVLIAILLCVTICYYMIAGLIRSDVQVSSYQIGEGYYSINPTTILDSLAKGNTDVFIPLVATPEVEPTPSEQPVHWTQVDYFRIEQALFDLVWKDSSTNWTLSDMSFGLDCVDISNGLQYAYFKLYKITHTTHTPRGYESRIKRNIYIIPREYSTDWGETEYYPDIISRKKIDLTKLKITADDALLIAEKNGGFEARLANDNECHIFLTMVPMSNYNGWQVRYIGIENDLFHINIDPDTGKFKIVPPK